MNRPLLYTDPEGLFPISAYYPPPAGMPLENYGYALGITVTTSDLHGTTTNPNTGLWGATSLAFGRAFMDSLTAGGAPTLSPSDRILSSINSSAAQTLGNLMVGFGDIVSFGLTDLYRDEAGLANTISEDSAAYAIGQVAGIAHGVALGGAGVGRTAGYSVQFQRYSKAGGGGANLIKGGKRLFAVDWHRFKLRGRPVNRLHYHLGKTNSQMHKHRPWQGGWH